MKLNKLGNKLFALVQHWYWVKYFNIHWILYELLYELNP